MKTKTNTMETEKLTFEIACLYPNAKFVINGKVQYRNLKHFLGFSNPFYQISDCQLQLRSIEDLTEKEKQEINDIIDDKYDGTKDIFTGVYIISNYSKYVFDYLRSINIDIDGFIECGKAVKG